MTGDDRFIVLLAGTAGNRAGASRPQAYCRNSGQPLSPFVVAAFLITTGISLLLVGVNNLLAVGKPYAASSAAVPTANPNPLTATANRLILAPDERSLQVDLVHLDRTVQVAGCVGNREPGPSTPTQRAAAQISEAIGVRQY
jgi:hypothetical protein